MVQFITPILAYHSDFERDFGHADSLGLILTCLVVALITYGLTRGGSK